MINILGHLIPWLEYVNEGCLYQMQVTIMEKQQIIRRGNILDYTWVGGKTWHFWQLKSIRESSVLVR